MAVGTNLGNAAEYEPTLFVDAFKQLRTWRTRDAVDGAPFDSNLADQIPLNGNGWPNEVPFVPVVGPPQIVHSIFPIRGAGTWTLAAEGTGRIRISTTENVLASRNYDFNGGVQQLQIPVGQPQTGLRATGFLEILESDASDPLRNMSFTAPPSQVSPESTPFQKSYYDRMEDFSCLRFMDLARTNNNQTVSWNDRITPSSYSQGTDKGVALEHLVALANARERSAWFCVPARVDDQYVRNMAALIRDTLDADLKCFIEYSNETWNSIFTQSNWVQDRGEALGLDPNRYTAGQRYHVLRSAEIWEIFEDEFGGSSASRLVKVMASQSANVGLSTTRMDALSDPQINPIGIRPDVLAIAPYFGNSVGDDLVTEGLVDTVTIGEILDRAENELNTGLTDAVQDHSFLAAQHDVWLVTYEGGQHLVGNFGNENIDELTDKLIAANRTARMGSLYSDYLNILDQNGVQLHCNFLLAGEPSKFGSWGILEDQDQPAVDAPKFTAHTNWIANNPPSNVIPVARFDEDSLIDLDGDGSEEIQLDGRASRDLDGEIVQWEWFVGGNSVGTGSLLVLDLSLGQYDIKLQVTDNDGVIADKSQTYIVAPGAAANVMVESDFTGANPSANTPWQQTNQLGANVDISGWELGAGLLSSSLSNAFGVTGIFDPNPVEFEDSLVDDNFLTFTVSPAPDHVLDLRGASLSFTIERIGFHASRQFHVLSSVGGFDSASEIFTSEYTTSQAPQEYQLVLPFDGFRTVEPIEFRIYMSGGQFAGHQTSLDSFELRGASEVLILGDVNLSGVVSFLDISPFIDLLIAGGYQPEADINFDGAVDFLDIGPFITILGSN